MEKVSEAKQTKQVAEKMSYESNVLPNFWLEVAWLWQEPLPKVLDVARLLGLLDQS